MITQEEEKRFAELQSMALDAARKGDTELLLPMLDAGMPVNLVDEKGNSLLMLAAYHGHPDLAKVLLERGADPDQRNDRSQTPLAGVAFKGRLDLVRLLVEYGADPFADQGGGRFPIQFAALFGHTDIVSYLESLSPGRSRGLVLLAGITKVIRKVICGVMGKNFKFVVAG